MTFSKNLPTGLWVFSVFSNCCSSSPLHPSSCCACSSPSLSAVSEEGSSLNAGDNDVVLTASGQVENQIWYWSWFSLRALSLTISSVIIPCYSVFTVITEFWIIGIVLARSESIRWCFSYCFFLFVFLIGYLGEFPNHTLTLSELNLLQSREKCGNEWTFYMQGNTVSVFLFQVQRRRAGSPCLKQKFFIILLPQIQQHVYNWSK